MEMITQIESTMEIEFHLGCEKSEKERAAISRRWPQGMLLYRGSIEKPRSLVGDGEFPGWWLEWFILLLYGLPLSPSCQHHHHERPHSTGERCDNGGKGGGERRRW